MKTKLLRKVRKDYVITEVLHVTSRCNDAAKKSEKDWGLPFFCMKYNWDGLGSYEVYAKDVQAAKDYITSHVIKEYKHKMKKKPNLGKKVWHLDK